MEHPSIVPNAVQPPTAAQPHRVRQKGNDITLMHWFGYLLETRPLAFWSGVWVSVFLVAVVAVGSLLSPNASERRSVSAIALGSDSGVATQPLENRGKVPFWMFGAIAVTCTAGSILVSRQLKPDAPSGAAATPRQVRPKRPVAVSRSRRPRQSKPVARQPQRLQPYSPTEPLFQTSNPIQSMSPVSPERQPVVSAANRPTGVPSFVVKTAKKSAPSGDQSSVSRTASQPGAHSHSRLAHSLPTKVPVTVVPQDQVHPLDWTQPRLADAVDLRKRKSVQSFL